MPMYRVRLESPDLTRDDGEPHFRVTTLAAADEGEARAICERREYAIAAHRYSDADAAALEQAEAKAVDAGLRPDAVTRMRLGSHRQERPYAVVSIEELS